MIAVLFSNLLVTSIGAGQVIECPKVFPSDALVLPVEIPGRNGTARLVRARLSHAYIHSGELYGEQTMVPPGSSKVGGSWDAHYDFMPSERKWLVCSFGGSAWGEGNLEWWESLNPKLSRCVLKVREYIERPYPTRWTAAATCT